MLGMKILVFELATHYKVVTIWLNVKSYFIVQHTDLGAFLKRYDKAIVKQYSEQM